MARIELTPEVFDDFERSLEHMAQFEIEDARQRISTIVESLQILAHSPLIGRKVRDGKRELVIGERAWAHVALYRFVAEIDFVFILAIRNQRESRYRR